MAHGQAERLSAREVLVAVASRRGADLSAHQTMAFEWAKAAGFDQLVREHQSLVAAAMARRWESALDAAGLPGDMLAQARRSPGVGRPAQCPAGRRRPWARGRLRPGGAGQAVDGPGRGPRRCAPGAPAALGEVDRRELAAPPGPGSRPGPSGLGDRRRRPRQSGRRARGRHRQAGPGPGRRGCARLARPGPRPSARRPLVRPSPRPGGTAWRSSPPTGTVGVLPPRASSENRRASARSPRLPTAPGRKGPDRKRLAWPAWRLRPQLRRTTA